MNEATNPETPRELEQVLTTLDWSKVKHPEDGVAVVLAQLGKTPKSATRTLLKFLAKLLGMHHNDSDSAECPFWAKSWLDGATREELGQLAQVLTTASVPSTVRARAIDAAWYRRACSPTLACEAISAYLEAATALLGLEHWLLAHSCVRRAVMLSAELRPRSDEHQALLHRLAELLEEVGPRDPSYCTQRIMLLLITQGYRDGGSMPALANALAARAIEQHDYQRAQRYLETKVAWHRHRGEPDEELDATADLAVCLEDSARVYVAENVHAAIRSQTQAVTAWRRLGDSTKAEAAQRRLRKLQRRSVPKSSILMGDLSESVSQAREAVSGKSPMEALIALAFLGETHRLVRLEQYSKERLKNNIYHAFVPRVSVTATAREQNIPPETDESNVNEARVNGIRAMQVFARGSIVPATSRVQVEHRFTWQDLSVLVENLRFFSLDQGRSFARGLALGFDGEYCLAAHVLLPHLQRSLRNWMEARGMVVGNLVDSGLRDEFELGTLLATAQLKDLLGENEHFELELLLGHKYGSNLKNELARGLFATCPQDALCAYFWWRMLRCLVVLSGAVDVVEISPGFSELSYPSRLDHYLSARPHRLAMAQQQLEQRLPPVADPLELAAECGNTELVRELLNAGADPFRPGCRNEIPLVKALGRGHLETAQVMLSAVPEAERGQGLQAALFYSVYPRDLAAVHYILKHFPDICNEPVDSTEESLLHFAATHGKLELARALLNAGADPLRFNLVGRTPLVKALLEEHFETAQVLLSAVPEAKRRSQLKAALDFCVYARNLRAVHYILKHTPDIYDEPVQSGCESPLDGAATRGDADLLRLLLACGPCRIEGVSATHEHRPGYTALMSAVLAGGLDAVRVLVDGGADLRAREQRGGYTPLMFACYMDKRGESAQIAAFLLARGAELDVQAYDGCTPLMIAAEDGQYDVAQTLLRFGPRLDVRDRGGRDVFELARVRPSHHRVDELLAEYVSGYATRL